MEDERLARITIYQGFGPRWEPLRRAPHRREEPSATVLESAWNMDGLLGQRISSANYKAWMPLIISALEVLMLEQAGLCTVISIATESSARHARQSVPGKPLFMPAMVCLENLLQPTLLTLWRTDSEQ